MTGAIAQRVLPSSRSLISNGARRPSPASAIDYLSKPCPLIRHIRRSALGIFDDAERHLRYGVIHRCGIMRLITQRNCGTSSIVLIVSKFKRFLAINIKFCDAHSFFDQQKMNDMRRSRRWAGNAMWHYQPGEIVASACFHCAN